MSEIAPFRYFMPTEIRFGSGCLDELGRCCSSFGARPLIITGRHSARRTGLLDRALAQLPDAVVFNEAEENPRTETCEKAARICRDAGCDVIVAIGGGSPMDVAKAAAGLALNDGPCSAYFGSDLFKNGVLPIIAVPTTAGTGSEVTPYAVIVDSAEGQKRTVKGRLLFPRIALLDPALTLTMPPAVTVSTGLDALSQAMEGLVSKMSTPMSDTIAIETCAIVKKWLPRAVKDGSDLQARAQMLYAAMLSGCVIAQTGTTLVHGMGYYFTLHCGLPHGLANGLLLTPIFQHNALYEPEKVAAIATALGVPAEPTPEAARATIGQAIHALFADCALSPAATDAGVDPSMLPDFAKDCHSDPYRFKNQLGDLTEQDVLWFYQCACDGAILA